MKTKEMKTREEKDKAAKKGKQSLTIVTRRFQILVFPRLT